MFLQVMVDAPEEVPTLLAGKLALKYTATDLDAMKAIALAAKKRSLSDFNKVLSIIQLCVRIFSLSLWFRDINFDLVQAFGEFREELQMDAVVKKHFHHLSERMLEKELSRLAHIFFWII